MLAPQVCLAAKSQRQMASDCHLHIFGDWGRGGGVKTYRMLEGGTRPESCPSKTWTLTPKLTIFYRISVERGQFQGPLEIKNFHPPHDFRRFDPPLSLPFAHLLCVPNQRQGGPGSVRFGYGLGMERFERFWFSVSAVPLRSGFLCVSVQFNREDGSGFGSWKTVLAVPVPRSVPAKTVPTVPVSGSGSVPGPNHQKSAGDGGNISALWKVIFICHCC